jgi:hypothetical protein
MAKLEDKPFDQAVMVHGARPGLVQNIGSVREAAEWLLHKWPADSESETSWSARKACLEALQGQGDAATARQAFRDAAKEAGILIGDAFRPPPKPKKRKR